jgi:hypothetical protein
MERHKKMTQQQLEDFTKAYFNIHPKEEKSKQFPISLFHLINFATIIAKKAQV